MKIPRTFLFASRIIMPPGANQYITEVQYVLTNFDASAVSFNIETAFYQDTYLAQPGAFIAEFNSDEFTVAAGEGLFLNVKLEFPIWLPQTVWVGFYFYTSTSSLSQLNNIGVGIVDLPASYGITDNLLFNATFDGDAGTNNIAGTFNVFGIDQLFSANLYLVLLNC